MFKNKYKRLLVLTLLSVSVLSACSDDSNTNTSKNKTVTDEDLTKLSHEQSKHGIKNIVERGAEGLDQMVLDALERKYQQPFGMIDSINRGGVVFGTAISESGIFYNFAYTEETSSLSDVIEKTFYKLDLTDEVKSALVKYDGDFLTASYLSNTGVLNVVIAKPEGVEIESSDLEKIAESGLSTVIEVRVYSLSDAAYTGLVKSVLEEGKLLTSDLIKGYLFTSYDSYTSDFDKSLCFGSGAFSYTGTCSDVREDSVRGIDSPEASLVEPSETVSEDSKNE